MTPKTHRYRSLPPGASTVELWRDHVGSWPATGRERDWLFSAGPGRFIGCVTPSPSFSSPGKLLVAQHRLGHSDLSTTLRHYGWAPAPDDTEIADHLDAVLNRRYSSLPPEA